jgi:hypothetical protein
MNNFLRYFVIVICLYASNSAEGSIKDYFIFIDLKEIVNQGFNDDKPGDREGGWADFGDKACFWNILAAEIILVSH